MGHLPGASYPKNVLCLSSKVTDSDMVPEMMDGFIDFPNAPLV